MLFFRCFQALTCYCMISMWSRVSFHIQQTVEFVHFVFTSVCCWTVQKMESDTGLLHRDGSEGIKILQSPPRLTLNAADLTSDSDDSLHSSQFDGAMYLFTHRMPPTPTGLHPKIFGRSDWNQHWTGGYVLLQQLMKWSRKVSLRDISTSLEAYQTSKHSYYKVIYTECMLACVWSAVKYRHVVSDPTLQTDAVGTPLESFTVMYLCHCNINQASFILKVWPLLGCPEMTLEGNYSVIFWVGSENMLVWLANTAHYHMTLFGFAAKSWSRAKLLCQTSLCFFARALLRQHSGLIEMNEGG